MIYCFLSSPHPHGLPAFHRCSLHEVLDTEEGASFSWGMNFCETPFMRSVTWPVVAVCAVVALCLGACQSVQDMSFKKLSDNTYQLTVADETDQAANINALNGAARLCQRLGMQSQTVSGESSMVQGVHHFALTFRCF